MPPTLTLHPEKWVQNGYTLARHPQSDLPVFLSGAIPDEVVTARIVKERSSHLFAVVEEVQQASPLRIPSDCPAFPLCGGCSFRHITYEEERKVKLSLFRELPHLWSLKGGETPMRHSRPVEYRNHIQIQFDGTNRGFFALHSNRVVPFPEGGCRHISEEMNRVIREAGFSEAGGRLPFRQTPLELFTPEQLKSRREIEERIPLKDDTEFSWNFPADGFFQSNRFLLGEWLEQLYAWVPPGAPRTTELFCGSGLIGGYLRPLLGLYRGYESGRSSLKSARNNFQRLGFKGSFETRDLYKESPPLDGTELLITNPPRAGMNRSLLDQVDAARIPHILYSSCNPHTLERDISVLERKGYKVREGVIFDFFPRTPHLEMAVSLSL